MHRFWSEGCQPHPARIDLCDLGERGKKWDSSSKETQNIAHLLMVMREPVACHSEAHPEDS